MKIYEAKLTFEVIREDSAPQAINSASCIASYMNHAFDDPTVESFWVVMMNTKNKVLGRHMVSKGTATASLVHPREVFKPVILAGATAFAVVHNHPSGDPSPSSADIAVTRRINEAAKIMGITLHDHVIIGDPSCDPKKLGYYSFADSGLL